MNEACELSDLVVWPARDLVRLVGIPEHSRRSRLLRRGDDGADQSPADAAAPLVLADIEILEVALRVEEPRAALEKVVGKADQIAAIALGDHRMHRLRG